MFVELNGAGFQNKGAELMLLTVIQELSRSIPGVKFCMRPRPPYDRMLSLGVRPILDIAPRHRRNWIKHLGGKIVNRCISPRFCARHNVVHPFDVDALVDISGYAFGDKLSLRSIQKLMDHSRSYQERGKPVVLLPQMFGPFEKPGFARAIADALKFIDLAYAREAASFDHLVRAAGRKPNIRLAPDISIFVEPDQGPPGIRGEPFCCVVPNVRMVSHQATDWGGEYMKLLNRAVTQVLAAGLDVVILVHSTNGEDHKLAEELAASVGRSFEQRCAIYSDEDPLMLKALIWRSSFLIGSRYHSLVGALSGAVPVIMLGWAHKYAELARDFGVEQFVLSPEDAKTRMASLIEVLLDTNQHKALRKLLAEKKHSMAKSNRIMWQETVACLQSRA